MEDLFITGIHIHEVRHLKDIEIPLSPTKRKHLILTGRNGSGKTSVLRSLAHAIYKQHGGTELPFQPIGNTTASFHSTQKKIVEAWKEGQWISGYFEAKRGPKFKVPKGVANTNIGKIGRQLPMHSGPGEDFVQHLVNLWMDRLLFRDEKNLDAANEISNWFDQLEGMLSNLMGVETTLRYDRENRNFIILERNKSPYTFHELSDGYGAVLEVVSELMIRMQYQNIRRFSVPGIVLIDEIETHLHIDLQKKILPFLTQLFPCIQFIVTTHSPFVLNSVDNAVIYDLEKRTCVEDLHGYSSEILVESYFQSDKYSVTLKDQVAEYEALMALDEPTDFQLDRIDELASYLDTLPKYLSDELTVKLQQIRLKSLKPQQ